MNVWSALDSNRSWTILKQWKKTMQKKSLPQSSISGFRSIAARVTSIQEPTMKEDLSLPMRTNLMFEVKQQFKLVINKSAFNIVLSNVGV